MSDQELRCRQVVELVTDYLEGALAAPERARFEEHLAGCSGCDAYVVQMKTTIEVTGTLPEEPLPPAALGQLLEAFRDFPRE